MVTLCVRVLRLGLLGLLGLPGACGGRPALLADGAVPRPTSPDGAPGLAADQGQHPSPPLAPSWSCATRSDGRTLCSLAGGLPPGGSGWRCHLHRTEPGKELPSSGDPETWTCDGSAASDPSGAGWSCKELPLPARDAPPSGLWRCSKVGPTDEPTADHSWVCWKSSKAGGTVCEQQVSTGPHALDGCYPGQRRWCGGLVYDGWGQVECDAATGRWRTKLSSAGQTVIDCRETGDGARPDTACACYHFFFDATCCERTDCVLPDGTSGASCPASAGALCSECDPTGKDCQEPGARCIITNQHETFCGRLCSTDAPCPAGYACMTIKLAGNQTSEQCVPTDFSCYF